MLLEICKYKDVYRDHVHKVSYIYYLFASIRGTHQKK